MFTDTHEIEASSFAMQEYSNPVKAISVIDKKKNNARQKKIAKWKEYLKNILNPDLDYIKNAQKKSIKKRL